VPVELEKGTQREPQGNHIATKGRLVSIFGGNFFDAEAESVGSYRFLFTELCFHAKITTYPYPFPKFLV
jgi:hypothetical protein